MDPIELRSTNRVLGTLPKAEIEISKIEVLDLRDGSLPKLLTT